MLRYSENATVPLKHWRIPASIILGICLQSCVQTRPEGHKAVIARQEAADPMPVRQSPNPWDPVGGFMDPPTYWIIGDKAARIDLDKVTRVGIDFDESWDSTNRDGKRFRHREMEITSRREISSIRHAFMQNRKYREGWYHGSMDRFVFYMEDGKTFTFGMRPDINCDPWPEDRMYLSYWRREFKGVDPRGYFGSDMEDRPNLPPPTKEQTLENLRKLRELHNQVISTNPPVR